MSRTAGTGTHTAKIRCPLCQKSFHRQLIETHAAECNGAAPADASSSQPATSETKGVQRETQGCSEIVILSQEDQENQRSSSSCPEGKDTATLMRLVADSWRIASDYDSYPHNLVCQRERIKQLNEAPSNQQGRYVLFWVQQDVRAQCNHALEYAVAEANFFGVPLVAVYGLWAKFPDANERMFAFLLQGLCDLREDLRARGVQLCVLLAPPPEAVRQLGAEAASIVCDRGYARICRAWREQVASEASCRVVQVETSVVVPVELASDHLEPAARTLRPKIHRQLSRFLVGIQVGTLQHSSLDTKLALEQATVLNVAETDEVIDFLKDHGLDTSVPPVKGFIGGARAALRHLCAFLGKEGEESQVTATGGLRRYGNGKANDPSHSCTSGLSPFLHFGHISSLHIALAVRAVEGCVNRNVFRGSMGPSSSVAGASNVEAFLEELIVRRELARNFCYFNGAHYDSFKCLPNWAQDTLRQHCLDDRAVTYTWEQLQRGETGDACWNAAQWQMICTGHMHNYLRMYWCKKILEWGPNPSEAFAWAVRLNNKFELDGRDENAYMGIAWCFGHHDTPFPERPIFGSVRSMTLKGIESKFDMAKYRRNVHSTCLRATECEPRLRSLLPLLATQLPSNVGPGKRKREANPASRDIRAFFGSKVT